MNILTVKRLPENEIELNILKEMFGQDIVVNLQDEGLIEPLGLRSATQLEIKFLEEMKKLMEQNVEN